MPLPKNNLLFGYEPKLTDEQREYVNAIFDKQFVICDAKAGSGKTTLAVACAKLLGKDLLYLFNPTEEHRMGFRPGTQGEKEKAYISPLIDALLEIGENPTQVIYDETNIENLKRGQVWVYAMSHIFARGTNIKGKTVIIDEAQNWTVGDLKKVLTRIHDHDTKVIMIGHVGQIDLRDKSLSGFKRYLDHFKDEEYVKVCKLSVNFRGRLAQKADDLIE